MFKTKIRDARWVRKIDDLIAEISQLPIVLWLATVLRHYAPGECEPDIVVQSDLNPAVVRYFEQFSNAEWERTQHVADCRSFARRAGILAEASDPETADVYWFNCLLRHSPRFEHQPTGGGWLYNFPAATIELLQRLKRTGALPEPASAPPPRSDESEAAGQETFDLNKPPVKPYDHQEYPFLLYHHATRQTRAAQDPEERQRMLSEGWSI